MHTANINLFWVVLFRTVQTMLDSAPTLLCGLFVAGVMRGMIGPEAIRRWFTSDPRIAPVRAWLTGLLLPVCSFGVLPVAWEMKRAGVPRAAVLTFLFFAPVANPFSLIYAFQRLEVFGTWGLAAIMILLALSFAVTTGLGFMLGHWMPEAMAVPNLPALPARGTRRAGIVILTAARGLVGDLLLYLIVGGVGSGFLAIVSGGALEQAMNDRAITAPLHIAAVSVPLQTPPSRGTMLVCEALLSGVTVGKVFVFLLLGIGIHLGTLVWIVATYGLRISTVAVSFVVGLAIVIGAVLAVSIPTLETSKSCQFLEIESSGGYKVAKERALRTTVMNDAGELQWFPLAGASALAGLWLIGIVTLFLGDRASITRLMDDRAGATTQTESNVWSTAVSGQQRTFAVMAIVVVCVVGGMYIYYPAPSELLSQIDGVQTELSLALRTEPVQRRQAIRLTAQWKRLQNKLVIADFLRRGAIDATLKSASARVATAIDHLRASIDAATAENEMKALVRESQDALTQCREIIEAKRPAGDKSVR